MAQTSFPIYHTGYYTHGDFAKLVPAMAGREVTATVSIRAPRRIWAFMTATDVATGRVTVLVPR